MQEIYSSSDLWLCAYLLCVSDTELQDLQINRNGRVNISFILCGTNLTHLAKDYCEEQAFANVTQLRSKLNFLRDIVFQSRKSV